MLQQPTGPREYTSRLDNLKLLAFLREQGMREKDIESLRIRFAENKTRAGGYHPFFHVIEISTMRKKGKLSSFTRDSQQEILFDLNETLMHEICHALDRRNAMVWLSKLLFIGITMLLAWILFQGTFWFFVTNVAFVLCYFAGFFDRILLAEIRAKAFERRYGRSPLLFRQP